jgi:hypothetical protein
MAMITSAPGLRPAKYGLLSAANVKNGPGDWENGVTFTPNGCQVIHAHDSQCWATGSAEKTIQACNAAAVFAPHTLELTIEWSTADHFDVEKFLDEQFVAGAQSVMERLQELGVVAVTAGTDISIPALSGTVATTGIKGRANVATTTLASADTAVSGTYTDPVEALGMLEAKLLDASDHLGSAGTIYMSPALAVFLTQQICDDEGDTLYTKATGSKVVIGNYSPTIMYGHTGDVDVYVSDFRATSMTYHPNNTKIVQGELLVLVAWNGCSMFSVTVS